MSQDEAVPTIGRSRALAAVGAVLAALTLPACGDDDEAAEETAAPTTGETTTEQGATTAADGDATETSGGETEAEEQPPAPEPEQCTYTAPPGRLAEDEIAIELSGVDCEQGQRLAKSAALGQPAGANLTVSRDGFECQPSTRTKGANVTYTCSGEGGEVSFDVVWSDQPG
jgi:hypothetical protein